MAFVHANLDGIDLLDPKQLREECIRLGVDTSWYGKPNSFTMSTGKDPGFGHVLLSFSDLKLMDLNSSTHKLVFAQDDGTKEKKKVNEVTVTIDRLIIDSYELILSGNEDNDYTAAMVHLKDRRVFGELTTINKMYNARPFTDIGLAANDYYEESKNGGTSPWTWQEMLQDIWDNVLPSSFGSMPSASFPAGTPEQFVFQGMNGWDAFFEAISEIGFTIGIDYQGQFQFYKLDGADDRDKMNAAINQIASSLIDRSGSKQSDIPRVPEKFIVYFRRSDFSYQKQPDGATDGRADVKSAQDYQYLYPYFEKEIQTANIGLYRPEPGITEGIHSEMFAVFDEDGVIQNQSDIDNEALQLAGSYVDNRVSDFFGSVNLYGGVQTLWPNSLIEKTRWLDIGSGMMTQIHAYPRTSRNFFQSPSKTDRHNRFFIGKLTEALAEGGSAQATGQYGTDSTGDIQWNDVANVTETIHSINVTKGVGDLALCIWWPQNGRWVVVGGGGGGNQLFDCTLLADLTSSDPSVSGSLDAAHNGDLPETTTVTLLNPAGMMFEGPSGTRGICASTKTADQYVILNLACTQQTP